MNPYLTAPVYHLDGGRLKPGEDTLAEEAPVALVYNGISHVVLMSTPQDLAELAVGFSLSEGIAQHIGQLYDVDVQAVCEGWSVQIELAASQFTALKERRRNISGRSGCGLCGIDSLAAAMPVLPVLNGRQPIALGDVDAVLAMLEHSQPLRRLTGALHSAAWVEEGEIKALFEDIGRHNALDKLLGHLARNQYDMQKGWLLVSSRASYEMVAKAVMLGIGCLVAVSAPTALSVRMAEQSNMTLIGFARPGRQTVYTHPEYLKAE